MSLNTTLRYLLFPLLLSTAGVYAQKAPKSVTPPVSLQSDLYESDRFHYQRTAILDKAYGPTNGQYQQTVERTEDKKITQIIPDKPILLTDSTLVSRIILEESISSPHRCIQASLLDANGNFVGVWKPADGPD